LDFVGHQRGLELISEEAELTNEGDRSRDDAALPANGLKNDARNVGAFVLEAVAKVPQAFEVAFALFLAEGTAIAVGVGSADDVEPLRVIVLVDVFASSEREGVPGASMKSRAERDEAVAMPRIHEGFEGTFDGATAARREEDFPIIFAGRDANETFRQQGLGDDVEVVARNFAKVVVNPPFKLSEVLVTEAQSPDSDASSHVQVLVSLDIINPRTFAAGMVNDGIDVPRLGCLGECLFRSGDPSFGVLGNLEIGAQFLQQLFRVFIHTYGRLPVIR
jgi:hypothetical protein